MIKKIKLVATLLMFTQVLIAQQKLPLIKANSLSVDIREGKRFKKGIWRINTSVKPDTYQAKINNGKVTFYTDLDSISFIIEPNKKYDFIILVNGKDSAYTEIVSIWKTNTNLNQIKLIINDSAARYVLTDLQRAIRENDEIVKRFKGYQIELEWHKRTSLPVKYYFEEGIEWYKSDTSLIPTFFKSMDDIKVLYEKQKNNISNLLFSYLPSNEGFNQNIYMVALTYCSGTSIDGDIMVDVTFDEGKNATLLLNLFIHETFHTAYKFYCSDIYDSNLKIDNLYYRQIFKSIQDEGIATWVGYNAVKSGLTPDEIKSNGLGLGSSDYFKLENDSCVKNAIKQVNKLIESANYLAKDSLDKVTWEVGTMQRAFYVVGAYMSKIIEERYGQKHLAGLIEKDLKVFVDEYNAIVTEEYKIIILNKGE